VSGIFSIVPVKAFEEGKSRLNAVLGPIKRAYFNRMFFDRTVARLLLFPGAAQTIIVSRSEAVLEQARRAGMVAVTEISDELNGALGLASEVARQLGATTVVVVPTDLPLLDASLLERIVSKASVGKTCILAPDESRQGTNLMVITPPDDTIFQFGEGSFEKHQILAKSRGYSVQVIDDRRLAFDIDNPADYERWIALCEASGGLYSEGLMYR
jgi:2-phospho-L-lactate guanylyltransferase